MTEATDDAPAPDPPREKPKVVAMRKKKDPSVAERSLDKLAEIEGYLKGPGKDCTFFVVFTDDMRIGIGVGEPAQYVGILEFEKRDFIETLPSPDDE